MGFIERLLAESGRKGPRVEYKQVGSSGLSWSTHEEPSVPVPIPGVRSWDEFTRQTHNETLTVVAIVVTGCGLSIVNDLPQEEGAQTYHKQVVYQALPHELFMSSLLVQRGFRNDAGKKLNDVTKWLQSKGFNTCEGGWDLRTVIHTDYLHPSLETYELIDLVAKYLRAQHLSSQAEYMLQRIFA